ncbi:MAG: DUF429 domain-containing protein [Phycisphaerae bacterium]
MTKRPTSTLIRLTGKAGPCKRSFQVAGVDGCRAGWFVVIILVVKKGSGANATCFFKLKDFLLARTFAEVLSKTTDCKLVCVDIPIGLSDGDKPRECDVAARKILGAKRASSVFPAPIRPCLSTNEYEVANAICRKFSGKGLSKQSFALLDKIRQVDDLMTPSLQRGVREIHPEISFWALNNQKAIQQNKKTVPGQAQRHKLLQRIFTDMDNILSKLPTVGFAMDDAFDALAAAWTAGRAVIGKAETLPKNPELDGKGLRMEILYPAPIVHE